MLSLLLGSSFAHAFCGTYVGPAGSALENGVSQVVMARDGQRTTLTLANAYDGNVADFGLIIPIPEVIGPDDAKVLDPGLFGVLDAYSGPRIVSYECEDFRDYYDYGAESDGDTGSASGGGAEGVTVEAQFTEGEYEIFVLSASGSGGLLSWLDDNGWELSDAAAPIVQEYLDAGQYFLAAKVSLGVVPESQSYLSPLQLAYDSDIWALPVRIGTSVSPGEQEVVIYALTKGEDGRAGISNYPEADLHDECMLPESVTSYTDWYDGELDVAFAEGRWITEYAWNPNGCDPCSSDPPSPELLAELGAAWTSDSTFFTRLRVRYTPEQVPQDLALYATGMQDSDQVRYITYKYELESTYETCGIGIPADPGTCDGQSGGDLNGDGVGDWIFDPVDESGTGVGGGYGGGCSAAPRASTPWLGLVASALALLGARRRRSWLRLERQEEGLEAAAVLRERRAELGRPDGGPDLERQAGRVGLVRPGHPGERPEGEDPPGRGLRGEVHVVQVRAAEREEDQPVLVLVPPRMAAGEGGGQGGLAAGVAGADEVAKLVRHGGRSAAAITGCRRARWPSPNPPPRSCCRRCARPGSRPGWRPARSSPRPSASG